MPQQVISANRLRDGFVVYLSPDDSWVDFVEGGQVVDSPEDAEALVQRAAVAVADQLIVDPYLIDVAETDGVLWPTKYREFIRATGPSIRPDLSKQNYVRGADSQGRS
jgi:hypothetical protein